MNPADAALLCHGCMEPCGESVCPQCGWVRGEWCREYPLALRPGALLGNRYVVGKVLGHGGFGITYLGWDLVLSRKKAIKECFPQGVAGRHDGDTQVFATSPAAREALQHDVNAFLAEARTVARFENHPNIVWIQDFFPANGTAYMIVEYLHGMTLEQYVKQRGGRIPWEEAARILMPVLDALREVHRVGILHRDVSPDNVYLLRSGQVKLIDFGAARAAAGVAGGLSVILKHGFGPMEQYQSTGNQGPWTDVYAAAGTIYRAITGKTPPPAPERYALDTLQPPSAMGVVISPVHERALLRAMAVAVEQRFQDIQAFQRALLESTPPPLPAGIPRPPVQAGSPVPPAPPPPASPQPGSTPLASTVPLGQHVPLGPTMPLPGIRPVPRRGFPWIWVAAGVGVLVAMLLVVIGAYQILKREPPVIVSFTAAPGLVVEGRPATLSWNVTGAQEVEIAGLGQQPVSGSVEVRPAISTQYRLIATAPDGSKSEMATMVNTRPPTVPKVLSFGVNPSEVDEGSPVVLAWKTADADAVAISIEDPNRIEINSISVKPEDEIRFDAGVTRYFRLEATSSDGELVTRDSLLVVRPKLRFTRDPALDLPVVSRFGFDRSTVAPGKAAKLSWDVQGATEIRLSGLAKTTVLNASGSLDVTFEQTATIGLSAANSYGTVTRQARVRVMPDIQAAPRR